MIGHGPGDDPDIEKCERCPQLEQLAEGYRIALLESAKLLQFILLPTTTDAERAEIYRRAFSAVPDLSDNQQGPPIPPSAPEVPKRPSGKVMSCPVEHGPAGDPLCPDCLRNEGEITGCF